MNEEFVVTIGGPHGSGRSTIAKAVAEHYGLDRFSTGNVFRQFAKERGISVMELNKTAEKEIDIEVDKQSKEAGLKGNVVFESDLAAWVNSEVPDKTVIKIWLDASPEKAGERIFNDEKTRTSEKYNTLEEAIEAVRTRFAADQARYKKYYDIDVLTLPYDKRINTDLLDVEGVKKEIFEFLDEKGLKHIE
jgi:predicted cytidylate kinase